MGNKENKKKIKGSILNPTETKSKWENEKQNLNQSIQNAILKP